MNVQALCHRCGADVPESAARFVVCAACAADPSAARQRLASRCHRNRLRAYARGATGFHRPADVRRLHRDQRGKCAYCQTPLGPVLASPPGYHVEHRTPLCRGGANDPSNLCLSCATCNAHKGSQTEGEFLTIQKR
jgi:5-methylcytosine-specific restriction endonuclease McrA